MYNISMRIFLIFLVGTIVLVLLGGIIYFVSSGSSFNFFKKTNVSISDNSFTTVIPGKLIVLTNTPFEPMEYLDEKGNLVGFDIDLINTIGKKLGLEVTIEQKDWDLMFELVKEHKVDLAISGITATQERGKDFNFSIPYLNSGQVVIVESTNPKTILNSSDLEAKKILVQKNTTGAIVAKEAKGNVVELDEIGESAIQELVSHNADAIVIDYVVGAKFVKDHKEIKLVGSQLTDEYYGILFPLSEKRLVSAVDRVIREMKENGELDAIKKLWIE